MTEYEIVSLLREHVGFIVSVLQWWVGITLGILVAVHVIGEELNGFITSILIALYSGFTAMLSGIMTSHGERADQIVVDLSILREQGVEVSTTVALILDQQEGAPPPLVVALGAICFWGLFTSTIAYVIYRYRKIKGPNS
jgi:hypothetical protein